MASRVAKIKEKLGTASWRHVNSSRNPADVVSQGVTASQLVKHSFWWNGPSWLCEKQSTWPQGEVTASCETEMEYRNVQSHFTTESNDEDVMKR